MAVGDMADYVVETDKGGRYISKEEALEIFRQAEENRFVHQITNIDGENKIFAICNCNVNVCYALRTSQLFNTPNMSRSAYVAHVTKKLRGLRQGGDLPGWGGKAGAEALQKGRQRGNLSEAAAALGGALGSPYVDRGLS